MAEEIGWNREANPSIRLVDRGVPRGKTITTFWQEDIAREESYDRVAKSVIYAVYFATCIMAGIHYLHDS